MTWCERLTSDEHGSSGQAGPWSWDEGGGGEGRVFCGVGVRLDPSLPNCCFLRRQCICSRIRCSRPAWLETRMTHDVSPMETNDLRCLPPFFPRLKHRKSSIYRNATSTKTSQNSFGTYTTTNTLSKLFICYILPIAVSPSQSYSIINTKLLSRSGPRFKTSTFLCSRISLQSIRF